MSNLIIYVAIFYLAHLFLTMTLSLHKVPFIEWTYTKGDTSKFTSFVAEPGILSLKVRKSSLVYKPPLQGIFKV